MEVPYVSFLLKHPQQSFTYIPCQHNGLHEWTVIDCVHFYHHVKIHGCLVDSILMGYEFYIASNLFL